MPNVETFECLDCGASLPDEIGVQTCECGYKVETYVGTVKK